MKNFFTTLILLIFIVVSALNAQTNWTKYPGNPVLTPGPAGDWDEGFTATPSVIFDGSTYHLWYGVYNGVTTRWDGIGYATSNDGISWTKYDDPATTNPPYSQSDPVLTPGPGNYDNIGAGLPSILKIGAEYHMWYASDNHAAGNQGITISHATSLNGIHWIKDSLNNPVLDVGSNGTWDDTWVNAPSVVFDGSMYHMWYAAWNGNAPPDNIRIGHATAIHPDSAWTKDIQHNPVLVFGTSTCWDYDRVDAPAVVFDGTMFHMFYSGGYMFTWRIGYAWSLDGSNWVKYDNPSTTIPLFSISDPVLFWGSYGTWDDSNVSHCSVLLDTLTDSLRMWYTGGDAAPGIAQVGYATTPISTHHVPGNYSTIQSAINAAADGDVVLVADGTYLENINFKGKAITVASHYYFDGDTSHISNTIIDGSQSTNPDSASVVYLISGEDTTSVLYGFTITNGSGTNSHYTWGGVQYPCRSGGGIFCWNSGGRFVSNKIINNTITGTEPFGGGLSTGDYGCDAWIILEHNKIINNTLIGGSFGTFAGGVGLCCNGKIVDNVISYNSCISIGYVSAGGGLNIDTEPQYPRMVYIEGNQITHNFVQGKGIPAQNNWAAYGGGIYNRNSKVLILDNEISYNQLTNVSSGNGSGGGIYMSQAASGSVINRNTISHDTSECTGLNYGGGIGVGSGNGLSITNNIISGNSATHGGGIRVRDNNAAIINNTIVNNTASTQGGGLHSYNSNPIVVNNILWDNQAPNNAGIDPSSLTRVHYSIVQGGYSGNGNLNIDPLFLPDDSLYHVNCTTDTSQCLNRGIDSVFISGTWYVAPETDFAGNPRPLPIGTHPDIGAFEYDVVNGLEEIQDNKIPLVFALKQNYPNPFNPSTTIEFSIPKVENVTLKIYNLLGQEVTTLVSDKLTPGEYKYTWDASHLASGVYIYKLETDNFNSTKKLILLK